MKLKLVAFLLIGMAGAVSGCLPDSDCSMTATCPVDDPGDASGGAAAMYSRDAETRRADATGQGGAGQAVPDASLSGMSGGTGQAPDASVGGMSGTTTEGGQPVVYIDTGVSIPGIDAADALVASDTGVGLPSNGNPDAGSPASVCGDGRIDASNNEACDLGAQNSATAYGRGKCTDQCRVAAYCGDTKVDAAFNEGCDDGKNDGTPGSCTPDCKGHVALPSCGDGIVQANEQCDNGMNNGAATSTCDKFCKFKCGNGAADSGEQCDDGKNTGAYGTCNANCTLAPRCGDGVKNGSEECDLGVSNKANAYGPNTCTTGCKNGGYCGDGVKNGSEACDLGAANQAAPYGANTCTLQCMAGDYCGDGKKTSPEECDDHNNVSKDGCSATCKTEVCGGYQQTCCSTATACTSANTSCIASICQCAVGTNRCNNACVSGSSVTQCGPSCLDCSQPNAIAACNGTKCANSCTHGNSLSACGVDPTGHPSCSEWDFESKDSRYPTEGWRIDAGGWSASDLATYGPLTISSAESYTGTHSLAIPVTVTDQGGGWVNIRVPLCSSGQAIDLAGKGMSFSARVITAADSPNPLHDYDITEYGAIDFGSTRLATLKLPPVSPVGSPWTVWSGDVEGSGGSTGPATHADLMFEILVTWKGTIYVDDVIIY